MGKPNPKFKKATIYGLQDMKLFPNVDTFETKSNSMVIVRSGWNEGVSITRVGDNNLFFALDLKGVDDLITVLTYWKENH